MRLTLLRCTQLILSAIDGDEVNSIADTTESVQVVDVLERTYYDIAATVDFPDAWDFFELEPSNDVTRPTLMYIPENVGKLEWVKYDVTETGDTKQNYQTIKPLERKAFIERMNKLDSAESDIYSFNLVADTGTFPIRGHNERNPTYYMTHDDRTLVFDSFDSGEGQTLQGNKTWCYGMKIPTFDRADDFIPDFEPRQFTLFFNEALSTAFTDVKQQTSPKAEQKARRAWNLHARKDPTVPNGDIYSDFTYDFGRRRHR